MSIYKYIYWHPEYEPIDKGIGDGKYLAQIHILVGYNRGTIANFQSMADELRKTFPDATNDEIAAGKVTKSSRVKGFSIISTGLRIEKREYPGWDQIHNGNPDYWW